MTFGDAEVDGCYSCAFLIRAKSGRDCDEPWIECRSLPEIAWAHAETVWLNPRAVTHFGFREPVEPRSRIRWARYPSTPMGLSC